MIKAILRPEYHAVTLEGHALSGEPGHDLVCASASILAYTLAANVRELEARKAVRDVVVELEPGKAFIRCTPANKHEKSVDLVYQSLCVGFEMLAHSYPQNISYEILGGVG